jgi:hypothetical protein
MDVRSVEVQMHKSADEYRKAKERVQDLEKYVQKMGSALALRTERWDQFRKYISTRAKLNFLQFLTQRGYSGSLEFDHARQRLIPRVRRLVDCLGEALVLLQRMAGSL